MKLCHFDVGLDQPLFLIAVPCTVDSLEFCVDMAGVKAFYEELVGPYIRLFYVRFLTHANLLIDRMEF